MPQLTRRNGGAACPGHWLLIHGLGTRPVQAAVGGTTCRRYSVALSIDERNATDLEACHYHSSESHLHSGPRGSILGALDMAQSHGEVTTHYTAHVSLEIDEHLGIPLSLYRSLQLNSYLPYFFHSK